MIIAFDCDGTLLQDATPWGALNGKPVPRQWVVDMLKGFFEAGHDIVVWSGGGKDYVDQIVRELGIGEYVHQTMGKTENPGHFDVCFDDLEVKMAKINIRV